YARTSPVGLAPAPSNCARTATQGSTNAGPHSSNVANKLDPRVDSDRDNRGAHGTHGSTNAGPHSSNAANKLDPRVDSDRDGRGIGNTTGGISSGPHHGTGALGTTGTHHDNHGSVLQHGSMGSAAKDGHHY